MGRILLGILILIFGPPSCIAAGAGLTATVFLAWIGLPLIFLSFIPGGIGGLLILSGIWKMFKKRKQKKKARAAAKKAQQAAQAQAAAMATVAAQQAAVQQQHIEQQQAALANSEQEHARQQHEEQMRQQQEAQMEEQLQRSVGPRRRSPAQNRPSEARESAESARYTRHHQAATSRTPSQAAKTGTTGEWIDAGARRPRRKKSS